MPSMRLFLLLLIPLLLLSTDAVAQMESGDRGILPRDTAQIFEVSGVEVDTTGETPQEARLNGWREAQRLGFAKLWSEQTKRPISEAPELGDDVLDGLVSAIVVEREQVGPTRYIASLGVQFDRTRTGSRIGLSGGRQRSAPVLLIPVTLTAGTVVALDQRTPWQRAWALLRTGDSQVDYVRASGLGVDPLLINAAVARRPDPVWWTNVADLYGAANILIAETSVKRAYPGGPAEARFVARIGRDREPIGSFTLRAADSSELPAMMQLGARRMDAMFQAAFRDGRIGIDDDIIPEEPPLPGEEEEETPERKAPERAPAPEASLYQIQVAVPTRAILDQAQAAILGTPGVTRLSVNDIDIGGVSSLLVSYAGSADELRRSLAAQGWNINYVDGLLRITQGGVRSGGDDDDDDDN